MGPKKERKESLRRENAIKEEKKYSIEDPINSESWRCVVIMAIEKTNSDSFLLKEFIEESSNGRRQEVSIIDYDGMVMKILKDFANGDLPYRYALLLTFSSVFQEAVEYIDKKIDVPVILLVKIVKALLFLYREESLMRAEKAAAGPVDPIKAMAERSADFGLLDIKKRDLVKKGDNGLKVRPPSITKQDTDLLKRGERAKEDQCIDDAPQNAYFKLYVLLTGFYNPDFPLELIKAEIPLHALICIDTSKTHMKQDSSFIRGKFQKQNSDLKSEEIQKFWEVFLKKLWDPAVSFYFKDIIFQTYMPRSLLCDRKKLREFIYREISYLMYDLSDLKRQLFNYINHFRLWNVSASKEKFDNMSFTYPENFPSECMNVPDVLNCIIDAVSDDTWRVQQSFSAYSSNTETTSTWTLNNQSSNVSLQGTPQSCSSDIHWSEELQNTNLLNVYLKIKELDIEYGLHLHYLDDSESIVSQSVEFQSDACVYKLGKCGKNLEKALLSEANGFESLWKRYSSELKPSYPIDYKLYALLMTRVFCSTQTNVALTQTESFTSRKGCSFELIKNIDKEMQKPHFTITDGSRSILKAAPYNMKNSSKSFFCPEEFKIVSPGKLKASSAPQFQMTPRLKIQTSYASDVFPGEISKNPFESLKGLVNECMFANVNNFDFLEFLNKTKLSKKELDFWNNYNCVDHFYSVLNDSIFVMLHNRKDSQGINHETFNETLKTPVGLRDFYDYILEDESEWLALQEELYQTRVILKNTVLQNKSFRDFSDSYFWLKDSIKYRQSINSKYDFLNEMSIVSESNEKINERPTIFGIFPDVKEVLFDGYDISDMAVQYSGLKTVYYSKDSSVTVQLFERLYGNQDLGIHVTTGSHTLHLYSYVCPEPHVIDPFTFHVTFNNGIIIAFGRRWIETYQEIEELAESITTVRSNINSSRQSIKKQSLKTKDKEFFYDMSASLPNGLCIRTVRRIVNPCYIKQFYLSKPNNTETRRLFLPNGNIVKMMKNGKVQILNGDASIITADSRDLITGENNFSKFELITAEGLIKTYEHGVVVTTKRLNVFQNRDMATNRVFYRRRDGTNYMVQNDGTFVVQFSDGTKMSTSTLMHENVVECPLENEEEEFGEEGNLEEYGEGGYPEKLGETDGEFGYVFVSTEIIAEHPDYATVMYNSQTESWRIVLPSNCAITVASDGNYAVDIDEEVELNVDDNIIRMTKFSSDHEPLSLFSADLSALDRKEGIYCQMEDNTGKVFIIEANSNCYILNEDSIEESDPAEESSAIQLEESELSEFVASADLQTCPSIRQDKSNKLTFENKYFVLRRELTNMEILHKDLVEKILGKLPNGSLVYTQNIPGTENRLFVLVTPKEQRKIKTWAVPSILPNPKYEPQGGKITSSTTYGLPPSWMHPFPKKKTKFKIPNELSCRVFMETKRTNFSPAVGAIDCYFCEVDEISEVKHSQILQNGVEKYLEKLSNDDQNTLKEIYTLAVASLIYEKRKMKPVNTEKLEHYLEISRHSVELQEYHKKSIRYHQVPNYFQHPAGMAWLILYDLLQKIQFPTKKITEKKPLKEKTTESTRSEKSSERSSEEIEYDLSVSAGQSFSDLSFRSDLSAETAPDILRRAGVCRCKVKGLKGYSSSPVVKCFGEETWEPFAEVSPPNVCDFQEIDLESLKKEGEGKKKPPMTLEDLMYLGLI